MLDPKTLIFFMIVHYHYFLLPFCLFIFSLLYYIYYYILCMSFIQKTLITYRHIKGPIFLKLGAGANTGLASWCMAHVGVTNTFLQFPTQQPRRSQTQHGGETEHIISGRNTESAGGVWASFSNDQSHELLSSPLNAATGDTGERA